jgi:hypothetical protein
MPSPSASTPYRSIASRIGLTIGGGSAVWLATLAVVHKPTMTTIGAAAVAVAVAVNAVEAIFKALPEIIKAISACKVAHINAKAEAKTMVMRTQTRTALAQAGIEPGKLVQAAEMLRLLPIDPDLPQGRRLNDQALARLLAPSRAKSISKKSANDPKNPDNTPRKPSDGGDSKVVPIRPEV